jgi:hypothetical protein
MTEEQTGKKFFTVRSFAHKNREQNCWPGTEATIWSIKAESPDNGFEEAFVTIGRRVLVDEEKFWEAVKNISEVKNSSNK